MFVHNSKKLQAGFTLIEVLIAFIILAVGLLAIVSLQATSKQYTHQSMQRTLAVSYAESIIERMRANPTALATYIARDTNNPLGGGTINAEPAPDCSEANPCSPTEVAAHDLWVFEQKMDGAAATIGPVGAEVSTTGLTDARMCMTFTANGPPGTGRTGFLTVRIQWIGLHDISDAVTVAGTNCNAAIPVNSEAARRQIVMNTYIADETEF